MILFRVMRTLSSIYYGEVQHPWGIPVENWAITQDEQQRISEFQKSLEARLM